MSCNKMSAGMIVGLLLFLCSCSQKESGITIYVDASQEETEITPWLYGACIEDVNHEIYGGLYDQRIFGESFEEPVPNPVFDDFSVYEGVWESGSMNEVSVRACPGGKLVYDSINISCGSVEVEMKFERGRGDNAGLLICVAKPGKGADNFYGYEISLAADGSRLIFAAHRNSFEPVANIPVSCNAAEWNCLKAVMDSGKIELFLNGGSVFTFNNNDTAMAKGKIALRTWNSHVKFRNLKIAQDTLSRTIAFKTQPTVSVSSQWKPIITGNPNAVFDLDTKTAFNGQNSQTIQFVSGVGVVGISNAGLNSWGIAVGNGQTFRGRLYLKSPYLEGSVKVALQSADGRKEYAMREINNVSGSWEKYSFELTSNTDDDKARFAVYITDPGNLRIDQVTLETTGDWRFEELPCRGDIGQAMVNQGLTFLRYGGTMINAPEYRFKKMIGDPDRRPPYRGHWYPYSTNGFGIEDFLEFCEAAGFTASFAINIEESPEDAADMIEYLNGSVTSEWGKKRAENGHPEPYNVKYIGIGNEEVLFNGDRADEYDHYIERFKLLHDAIKGKDSSVSLVNTAWWRPESPNIEKVFKALDGKADYWDYHPWADQLASGKEVEAELRKMKELFLRWNPNTTMKCAIFEENGNTHNMQRTLGHVTLQNAVRRMGDFVLTSCAANALQPYGQNDNGWDQGQIFFTPSRVWCMPPYYAQQMASRYHQPVLVGSIMEPETETLDVTATRSRDGSQLVLHIANTGEKSIPAVLNIKGFGNIKSAKAVSLAGEPTDTNTLEYPEKIIPKEQTIRNSTKQTYEIAPYAYTILVFTK
ncbi:MAG: DUF1080 domain-containing protein [Prevotellaceae bacterium]|nr:DUF1080 domain-containing protein [Prevotellaceae bacterium]